MVWIRLCFSRILVSFDKMYIMHDLNAKSPKHDDSSHDLNIIDPKPISKSHFNLWLLVENQGLTILYINLHLWHNSKNSKIVSLTSNPCEMALTQLYDHDFTLESRYPS